MGLFRNVTSPMAALGVAGEGYLGARGTGFDGGVRGLLAVRPLRLGVGLDYNIRDNDPDLILSFTHPLRRGGLLGLGGRLRIDYLPTRDQSFSVGFIVPLGQSWMGRTRPPSDHVKLSPPRPPQHPVHSRAVDPGLIEALAHVRDAADWVNRFTTPFFDPDAGSRDDAMRRFVKRVERFKTHVAERNALYPEGRSYPEEIRVYHEELDRAFSIAAGGPSAGRRAGESTSRGREISAQAREILLDELILPYNRLLGRLKKPDSTLGFAARARDAFESRLTQNADLPESARPALRHVFQVVLDQIEEHRGGSAHYWETSQLVWIPLQLGLREGEYDSQPELDALLERAVGERFSGGNEHHYVVNEKFQWELLRQIQAAEDYHVLWIHDYRGIDSFKAADQLGFDQVYHGYLKTLTERVRRYDATGTLPVYMVFLDQNFYEPNRGRIWMSVLEDPLHAKPDLPGEEGKELAARIAEAQQELRAAVAASSLLQERARIHGDDWLRNRIKVHVNVTNPVDWSYWSGQVIPLLGIPDVLMRDHRKISFYDVTEADPGRGEAIFTGMGIGEHYTGPTWEDRAILVTGPSLLGLKAAARQLLLNQGFDPEQIPYPLRRKPMAENYAQIVAEREEQGFRFRSMQIHNQTGYGPKLINTAKATIYNLMPEGSVLIVPDSLWNSPFWAGMLVGSALRGCRVYVISPALENAPSAGFPQMSRAQEIFAQMIVIQQRLGDEIEASGGRLRTGIYATDLDVGDLAGRAARHYDGVISNPMFQDLRRDIDLTDPGVRAEVEEQFRKRKARTLKKLAALGFEPGYITEDIEVRKPKLHLKAQIMLSEEALRIYQKVDWPRMGDEYFVHRAQQVHDRTEYEAVREEWDSMSELWDREAARIFQETTPEQREKAAGYLTVGSHNMDYRGMMMDGEVLYITSGGGITPGLIDLLLIASLSTWVEDLDSLDALIPPYNEWQRRIGRYIKYAL